MAIRREGTGSEAPSDSGQRSFGTIRGIMQYHELHLHPRCAKSDEHTRSRRVRDTGRTAFSTFN